MDKNLYFFVDEQGKQHGPVKAEYFRMHGIAASSLVWFEGLPRWVKASDVPYLKSFIKTHGVESLNQPSHYQDHLKSKLPAQGSVVGNPMEHLNLEVDVPKNWILESVLITLFWCFPFGIVGLIYAMRVDSLWSKGHYAESIKASRTAGCWVKWGFMIVLVIILLYLLISILVPTAEFSIFNYNKYLMNQGLFE